MKKHWITLSMMAVLLVPLGACRVTQTEEGEMPDVDIEASGGELPKYDVDAADVDISTDDKKITVPDVDVDVHGEEKTVPVPDIDITSPDDPDYVDDDVEEAAEDAAEEAPNRR